MGVKVIVVEPGGFKTDWAGSSMIVRDIPEAYADTVGAINRRPAEPRIEPSAAVTPSARWYAGPAGDAVRAAEILVQIAKRRDIPSRTARGSPRRRWSRSAIRSRSRHGVPGTDGIREHRVADRLSAGYTHPVTSAARAQRPGTRRPVTGVASPTGVKQRFLTSAQVKLMVRSAVGWSVSPASESGLWLVGVRYTVGRLMSGRLL